MDVLDHISIPISDPILLFAIMMLIILAAPLVTGKLRLPEIMGLIIAGVVIGPHGLNIIERDATMELLGAVGLLYIMFLAGLEIDLHQVKKNKRQSLGFGFLTFFLPLILGTAMAYYLLAMPLAPAILLASMFSSHTLITYPLVSRLGISKNRTVTTAIGGTIITDTLAMVVLAVISSMAKGEITPQFWVRMISLMVLYIGAMVVLIPRVGSHFFKNTRPDGASEYIFVMAVVFLAGFLAHLAGLEPIIGAFLAGLTLNNLIPEKGVLMNRIHFVGDALFIPFFLVSVGMLVNTRALVDDRSAWLTAGLMAAVALLSKWLAAEAGGRLQKLPLRERFLLYGLSVNQAAATLAAVLVGYRLELFGEAVLTGTIFMIIVTCLAGSFVTQGAGRRVARAEEQETSSAGAVPARVLIPFVNRDTAAELTDLALLVREQTTGEPLYPLVVAVEGPDVEGEIARGEKNLVSAVVRGTAAGVPVIPLTRVDINPASGILHAARDMRISLIVAEWDGKPSRAGMIYGRVLDRVLADSSRMVLIFHFGFPVNTVKRILLVLPPFVDQQPGFLSSVKTIKVLASQIGAEILILTDERTHESCYSGVRAVKPSVDMDFQELPSWHRLTDRLKQTVKDNTLLVVCSARTGELAWQPNFNHLPGRLSRDFPSNSFCFIYPPALASPEAGGGPETTPSLLSLLLPRRARFDLQGLGPEDALREILKGDYSSRQGGTGRLEAVLTALSPLEPIEMAPGVVLIHSHIPGIPLPALYLGVNKEGFDFPGIAEKPEIVFILLGKQGEHPEVHLKVLSELARALKEEGAVGNLLQSRSWDDLQKKFGFESPGGEV